MIVAERKPYEEIKAMLEGRKRILVAGCGTCVAVCNTGGEKEVGVLAEELRITSKMEDLGWEISEVTAQRQCEAEFLEPLKGAVEGADAVLSLACGAGIQLLAAQYTAVPVFPAVNTTFLGTNIAPGVWTEYCHGCGNCVLGETGGICPVARCSKSLVNGACGGTDKGMCEVDPKTIDCGWFLIYERLKERGQLDILRRMNEPRNWATDRGAGPRRLSREEMMKVDAAEGEGE
ncbi:MAG: methylenetetrahydrofolate reductase C-terminal domain-containing protein [Planctomycetota bacterium]|jgi:ferredoxin